MFVIVVGSREWQGDNAAHQVNALLDELKEKYGGGMVIVTSSTDKGVGRIIRERCLPDKASFQFIDLHIRVYAGLPKPKLAQVFNARDEALAALGEEFHVFVDANRRGTFESLVEMVESREPKRPLYKHLPASFPAPVELHEAEDTSAPEGGPDGDQGT